MLSVGAAAPSLTAAPSAPPPPPPPVVHKTVANLGIIIATGCFMATIAGFINVVTIMSVFGNPTSHVSGTSSKIAMFLVVQQSGKRDVQGPLLQQIFIVVFFLLGSTIAGCLVRAATFKLGKFFGILMIIESILLFFATVMYAGSSYVGAQYAAACACGLQNGMATRFSGAVVRTTHMSGIVTDIGLLLGNWMRWGDVSNLWRLKILVPLFFSFIGGGALGTLAFLKIGTNCLFIPASFTLVGGITFFAHGVLWGENGWCLDVLHIANRTLFSKKNSLDVASSEDASQSAQSLLPSQRPVSSALPTIAESSASSSTAVSVSTSNATAAAAAGGAAGDVRVEMASVRSHTARSD